MKKVLRSECKDCPHSSAHNGQLFCGWGKTRKPKHLVIGLGKSSKKPCALIEQPNA